MRALQKYVYVEIDQTRCDVATLDIDYAPGCFGWQVGRDARNSIARDGHISDCVDAIRRVDDMTAL